MTAAQVEELLDETTLQDLDFQPPCELAGVHAERRAPICPADEAVQIQPPCQCRGPQLVLMCTDCDTWLNTRWARCNTCWSPFTWQQIVLDRQPL